MIIISQSKRMIINFENILALGLSSLEDKSVAIKMYELNDKKGTTIARYETKERAKEILQEIVVTYRKCNRENFSNTYGYVQNKVYEMPAE